MTDTKTLNRVARRLHRDDIEIGNARDMARDMPWFELDDDGQDYYLQAAMWFINALEAADYDIVTAAQDLTYLYMQDNSHEENNPLIVIGIMHHSLTIVNDALKGGK